MEDAPPFPTSVDTPPPGVMKRTRLFPESATYTAPPAPYTACVGQLKAADSPTPSANARAPLPASVDTTPELMVACRT